MVKSNHFYEQDGKSATYDACGDANYVKNMGYSLHGTVPVFSLWDMGCDETWHRAVSLRGWEHILLIPTGSL
jgi:hypothetical protein